MGYPRDTFTPGERKRFLSKFNLPEDPEKRPKWLDERADFSAQDLKSQFSMDVHEQPQDAPAKTVRRLKNLYRRIKASVAQRISSHEAG